MKLIYVGRHGAVDVPMPGGAIDSVAWGEELTTSTEHAESLLEQHDNWKPADTAGKKSTAAAADKPAPSAEKE
jgi:hypothetical protein